MHFDSDINGYLITRKIEASLKKINLNRLSAQHARQLSETDKDQHAVRPATREAVESVSQMVYRNVASPSMTISPLSAFRLQILK